MSNIAKYMTVVHYKCNNCGYLNKIGDVSSKPVNFIGCGKCGKTIYTDGNLDELSTNELIKKMIEDSQ